MWSQSRLCLGVALLGACACLEEVAPFVGKQQGFAGNRIIPHAIASRR